MRVSYNSGIILSKMFTYYFQNYVGIIGAGLQTNNGGNRLHRSQVLAIASSMAVFCIPTSEKPSPSLFYIRLIH